MDCRLVAGNYVRHGAFSPDIIAAAMAGVWCTELQVILKPSEIVTQIEGVHVKFGCESPFTVITKLM